MEIIKKTNLSEAVAKQLLALISSGEFKFGGRLPSEAQLCQMLGVSRTAVREGIKVLAGINVITAFPGRGTFVNENPDIVVNDDALKIVLNRETINSIYEARSVLDSGIAKYVVLKANEEDIIALREALNKMERALESDPLDAKLGMEGSEGFHFTLCKAAHNKILENMALPLIKHVGLRVSKQMHSSPEILRAAIEDHRDILQGIEKRDIQMAVEAMEKHLKRAFETVYACQ
jgi:GntR family transcriptional repressor for pyruvate dehydrogenase complex